MYRANNKILIADDDSTNILLLKKGTQQLPYSFTFAKDGNEALKYMLNEPFDMFLLDIEMPGLSGFEVVEKYNEEMPECDIPILFLTANNDQDAILKGFNLGAVDYITKPFSIHEIRKRIQIHHDLFNSHRELNAYAQEMEAIAKARAEQLIHADRLATLGTIAAGIIHEINNPATFISGNIQILQNKFLPVITSILEESGRQDDIKIKIMMEELPKMCDGILTGVARIKKITDGLKAFSRSHKTDFKPVSLHSCIENAISFCTSSIPKSIEVTLNEETCSLSMFEGDAPQIEQIIINLIINSSHALENHQSPKISITTSESKNILTLKVKDNGPGIPDVLLEKIWDPFFTTKEKGKGTGLGLSICKEMIEAHKGNMTYTGELSKGAEFTIEIPKIQAKAS